MKSIESRPVGGEDHISWEEEPVKSTSGNRVPAGGKSTICLGANSFEEPKSSRAIEDPKISEDEGQLTRRVPAGGASTVCLGTDNCEDLSLSANS